MIRPSSGLPWRDHATMTAACRADPEAFWLEAARGLDWHVSPAASFRLKEDGQADWFADGRLNCCYNALDRHVLSGRGSQAALIWENPASGESACLSYHDLLERVSRFAGGLRALGVGLGDRVLISMPSIPEAAIAMLAVARLGAIHVFTFAGFAGAELASRIDATRPRVLIFSSCGYQNRRPVAQAGLVAEALAICGNPPQSCVVLQRAPLHVPTVPGRDHDFLALAASAPVDAVPVAATHPLYILHTSGTTGRPKGVVRDHGGHAVAIALSMPLIYGIGAGDAFCTSSDLGWVVGHSYAIYGPLLVGATSVMVECGHADVQIFWRLCDRLRVRVFLTAPSLLRLMRQQDPDGTRTAANDLSALSAVFVAGERIDDDTLRWVERATGRPAFDHWWQTETGWPIAGTCLGFGSPPTSRGRLPQVSPGFDLAVLDQHGLPVADEQAGELVLGLPLPPGCLRTLWDDETGFQHTYLATFPGHYRTLDHGVRMPDGGVTVLARTDDVIKIAGRRIAGSAIEDCIMRHAAVMECAVVSQSNSVRGEMPFAYLVLDTTAAVDVARLLPELNGLLRRRIGGFIRLRGLAVLETLPRTRSGKVVRRGLAA